MESTSLPPTNSIQGIRQRLLLWCRRAPEGFARVEFSDERARQQILQELRLGLAELHLALHEVTLPTGLAPTTLVRDLLSRLEKLPAGVVSISGFAAALPASPDDLSQALYAFNFSREALARPGQRQIWWMPPHFAEIFVRSAPDLNSWFLVRLVLQESGAVTVQAEPGITLAVASGPTITISGSASGYARVTGDLTSVRVDPAEARRHAADSTRRFERALAQGVPVAEAVDHLIGPAIATLREAGLESEARSLELEIAGKLAQAGEPGPRFDFFLSYTLSDERWAEWIAFVLEEAGYEVHLQAWDFQAGSNFVLEMHKAATGSDRTLIVLSPAFLASQFTQPEWAAAFAADPTAAQRKLLPVRVAPCDPPGLLKSIVYVDLVGLDEAVAREKLLRGVSKDRGKPPAKPGFPSSARPAAPKTGKAAFPRDLPTVWTVPFPPNPCFTGRELLLEGLEKALHVQRTPAITQPQAVHGLGGVGKTQLAVEYAWKHHSEYDAALWVAANSPDSVTANLAVLAGATALNLPEAAASDQASQVQAVLRWLRENRRWLLIFDNADTEEAVQAIRAVLPPVLQGHVLITSRRSNWPMGIGGMPVEVLDVATATHFLNQRTESLGSAGSLEMLEAVVKELGCLPLALEQAAAYVLRHRIDWQQYLELLSARRKELLAFRSEGGTQYPQSVAATWFVSQQKLSAPARAILRLVSFLAPEEAPRRLFLGGESILSEAMETLEGETGHAAGLPPTAGWVDEALAELANYSLIMLNPRTLSCHRLVQAVQELQIPPDSHRQWLSLVLRLVETFAPAQPQDVRTWPVWDVLWVHVERIIHHADRFGIEKPTTNLMNQLGLYFFQRALHPRAEVLMRRALAIDEPSYGPNHPDVAIRLNNLAQLLQATNRLAEAEPLMRRSLAIDEQSYGPNHPNVAIRLNNLAQLLQATNRLAEAEPLMRRSLAIDEGSYGPNHPNVAIRLNNLAQLLQATNRLAEAEPLMRRSLAIDQQSYGPNHPNVARDLNNLAQLLQATNRLAEAEPLMRRSLAILESSLGPDHPKTQTVRRNLEQLGS